MNDNYSHQLRFPDDLSDEAAAAFLSFLYELANAFESQYAGQLHRYYHDTDHRQTDFWDYSDPPF